MKFCTLVNLTSGTSSNIQSRLAELARAAGSKIVYIDRHQKWAEEVKAIRSRGYRRLVVAGGDGTISHLLTNLGPDWSEFEIGIIPGGTANDLARSLGIPLHATDRAWEIATRGATQAIDVVRVKNGEDFYYVNAASGGFGGDVAAELHSEDKRRWGPFAYWMTAVSHLVDMQEYDVQLEMDNASLNLSIYGLAVANGRYAGGGFPVAPDALVDDGLLTITVIPVSSTLELLADGIRFLLHAEDHPHIKTYHSSRLRVHAAPNLPFSIDGESSRKIDAGFEVLPKALNVVCGPNAPALSQTAGKRELEA